MDVIDGERFHREERPFYQAPHPELRPGDLCATRLGQAHTGVAGAAGARVLVIDVAV